MGKTEAIIEIIVFLALVFTYAKLCTHRNISLKGKVAELVSLYGWSIWSLLGNFKFTVWAIGIAVIGLIKISTTKKKKIERRSEGHFN